LLVYVLPPGALWRHFPTLFIREAA
jgi:hypothetical protein